MRSLYAIYRKEMGHYFVSPIAYVLVGLFLFLSGFFFDLYVNAANDQAPDAPTWVLRAFLGFLALVFLFFLPMVTMGVYAEERKRGTMELLMTSPITELQIVLGKFFASLTLFGAMLLPTAGCVVFIWLHTDPVPPFRIVLSGYLGALLFGGSLLALGSFLSSLPRSRSPRFWCCGPLISARAEPAARRGRFCSISRLSIITTILPEASLIRRV